MSRRSLRKRPIEIFNLSFLDVVSCGFGAIILLLVIVKVAEPFVLERSHTDLSGLVRELEVQLQEIRGEREILNRDLETRREQLSEVLEKLARLQGEMSNIEGRHAASRLELEAQTTIESQMALARQRLIRGSRTSRSPTPSRLAPRTKRKMAAPGNTESMGCACK